MKTFKTIVVEKKEIEDIYCNVCGEKIKIAITDCYEDYISIEKNWGYFSPFDGEKHNIEICSSCYKNFIDALKIPPFQK